MKVCANKYWNQSGIPFFTIVTPIFNRRKTIKRTIRSVENQTYKNLEYILIDDGSTETSDDIISDFMDNTTLPVMYIKKENGGVHTARNVGYERARGTLLICIDSDDELLPDTCKIFLDEWNKIPECKRDSYWQIKALCVDQKGVITSTKFPDKINFQSKEESFRCFSMADGEQLGCRVSSVLKENKFPEPEKVKFVDENVLWTRLEQKYNSWAVNEPVRIYHTEGDDHITNGKKSIQSCYNALWNSAYALNNKNRMISKRSLYFMMLFRYAVMKSIVYSCDKDFTLQQKLDEVIDRAVYCVMIIPAFVAAKIYRHNKMNN